VDGSLQVAVARLDGRVRILHGHPGQAYPAMPFEVADPGIAGVVAVDAAWHQDHLDLLTVAGDNLVRLRCADRTRTDAVGGPARAARLVVQSDGRRLLVALEPTGRVTLRPLDEPGGESIDLGVADALAAAPVRVGGRAECHVVLRLGPGTTTAHRD
jgi:hypothetical protein